MRLANELCWRLRDSSKRFTPLERRLLAILGACREGAQFSDRDLELAGPLQHLALVREIVGHFAEGSSRVSAEPDRLAELTGISEAAVLALWPHLQDHDFLQSRREP